MGCAPLNSNCIYCISHNSLLWKKLVLHHFVCEIGVSTIIQEFFAALCSVGPGVFFEGAWLRTENWKPDGHTSLPRQHTKPIRYFLQTPGSPGGHSPGRPRGPKVPNLQVTKLNKKKAHTPVQPWASFRRPHTGWFIESPSPSSHSLPLPVPPGFFNDGPEGSTNPPPPGESIFFGGWQSFSKT